MHHADADLDISTALRFHATEKICSVPGRLGQILLIGVSSGMLALWSRLTLAEVTIWDFLSGTAGDYVPRDKITIGLPAGDEER